MPKIRIAGTIIPNDHKWIYNWYEMDSFCINDLTKAISNEHDSLEISINSGGGSVDAGSEIYTAIKDHKGKVEIKIVGLAASAASVIAMAGDKVRISPTARIMIHNVSAQGSGDYRDMQRIADALKGSNETIASAYILKTGKSKEEIIEMMNKETWLTPEQAKELGFVDEIMFVDDNVQLVAGIKPDIIPMNIINKMINEKAQAELDFLKLKGATI